MKKLCFNRATKVAKTNFLLLLAVTVAFSINLVKPVEVQALPCWYGIGMEVTPLPSGCGAHVEVEAVHYDNSLNINASLSPDFAQELTLHIYNSAGETIATETYNLSTGNSFKYDVSQFPTGAYYFNITTNTGNPVFSNKFIVIE